jgi:DNA-binding GntR family transcriptional regulator
VSRIRIFINCEFEVEDDDPQKAAQTRDRLELIVAGWRERLEHSLAQHLEGKGVNFKFGDDEEEES